jgi:hypothetical protein
MSTTCFEQYVYIEAVRRIVGTHDLAGAIAGLAVSRTRLSIGQRMRSYSCSGIFDLVTVQGLRDRQAVSGVLTAPRRSPRSASPGSARPPSRRPDKGGKHYAYRDWLSFVVQEDTGTGTGMWCGATRKVQLTPGATKRTVSFWHQDNRRSGNPAGYHVKQLLLNGKVVWERDVTADQDAWQQTTIDLTAKLAGATSAALQWRPYERKGVGNSFVDVRVDDIAATGMQLSDPGVENAGTWTSGLSRQGGPVYCSAQVYHQNYGADLSARIAQMYAAG